MRLIVNNFLINFVLEFIKQNRCFVVKWTLLVKKICKMKKLFLLLVAFVGFSFSSSAQTQDSGDVKTISAEEFKQKADSGKYTIIDIRTPREFEAGHIKGAINIDFYKKSFFSKMEKYKNKAFLYYCRSGNRTGQAKRKFNQMGFKEGYELDRGIISWKRAGYGFVK